MNQLITFTKKEFFEQFRTSRLMLLAILFGLFGIMNPAIAKLTPWLMEQMSCQLAQSGITVGHVEVNALTSWAQYFKNMPMTLIVFLILFSSSLTSECQNQTLVILIAKGFKRWNVPAAKMILMAVLWTSGCLFSYGITYGYNAFFWDNKEARHVFFAAFCVYLYGFWLITLILPASAILRSGAGVMLAEAGAFLTAYLASLFADLKKYSPACLLNAGNLLTDAGTVSDYFGAFALTGILCTVNIVCAVCFFNKKQIS